MLSGLQKTAPFIQHDDDGKISFHSATGSPINLRILPKSYNSLNDQTRLQITPDGEFFLSANNASKLGQPMLHHPKGSMILDDGQALGVFSQAGQLKTGVVVKYDSMTFYPDKQSSPAVSFTAAGLGIRSNDPAVLVVKDLTDDSVIYLDTAGRELTSSMVFSRLNQPKWSIEAEANNQESLAILNALNESAIEFKPQQMNIFSPANPDQTLNVNGTVSFVDSPLKFLPVVGKDNPNQSVPVLQVKDSALQLAGVKSDSGIRFDINGSQKMQLVDQRLAIGSIPVPNAPTNSLYVNVGTYLSDGLFINEEQVHTKIFQDSTSEFKQVVENENQILTFDYDTGFELVSTQDNVAKVSFSDHFF